MTSKQFKEYKEKTNIIKDKLSKEEYIKKLTGKETQKEKTKKEDKKICYIIGTANSRFKAPFDTDNPNAEFWGVAHCLLLQDIKRLDKVFEIHLPYIYNQEISPYSNKPIIQHANKELRLFGMQGDVTVIAQKKDENLNKVEVFDRQYYKNKYMQLFPPSDAFYATNSIAWMILKAIDDGFEEIHLYGIHLETQGEWAYERPCNELWLGFFMGMMWERGIKTSVVYLPEEADVLRGFHEYGFADIEVRRKKIQAKLDMDNKIIEDLKNQERAVVGQLNNLHKELLMSYEDRVKNLQNQVFVYDKELKAMQGQSKEEYERVLKSKIQNIIKEQEANLMNVRSRMHAFAGAKDRTEYFLNELNA